jgi:hypothetical protein
MMLRPGALLRTFDRSIKMYDGLRKNKNFYQQKCPISAGAATPVLIAGIATSSVGAATNIGMRTDFFICNNRSFSYGF